MPLKVDMAVTRRNRRNMKLTCVVCRMSCRCLFTVPILLLLHCNTFEAGTLSAFSNDSSASPFELDGLMTVMSLS